jgi:hypothetical protein
MAGSTIRTEAPVHVEGISSKESHGVPVPVPDTHSQRLRRSRHAQEHLENLPIEILDRAKELQERVQYFASLKQQRHHKGEGAEHHIPPSLQKLVNDISDTEGVTERVRAEVFNDEDAKQVSGLSYGS